MTLSRKYFNILSGIVPAGALGVSVLLGSTLPSAANEHPTGLQPSAKDAVGVSERLAAIRDAMSAVTDPEGSAARPADGNRQLAWGNWWNNFGWYRPWGGWGWPNWNNWRNWNNWNNWWRNW
jgi:hypothetical protein